LGLEPVSIDFHRARTPAAIRARLERWERRRSNPGFAARHLESVPTPLGIELASVYVSLRERYPDVRPRRVDFASPSIRPLLGCTTFDDAMIEVSACFTHPRCLRVVRHDWEDGVRRAALLGTAPRAIPTWCSEAASVLIHEFGHLVDARVLAAGQAIAVQVYGALSIGVLPELRRPPQPGRWGTHLLNYPAADREALRGPAAGGRARARLIRRALQRRVAQELGSYAASSREELFAEAFAAAHVARDRDLRRRLRPLRRALEVSGLAVARRR
jgi:hypothetical protein